MHIFDVHDYGADPAASDNRAAFMAAHADLKAAGGGILTTGNTMFSVETPKDANGKLENIWAQQYKMSVTLPLDADNLWLKDFRVRQQPITVEAGGDPNNLLVIGVGDWTPTVQPNFSAMRRIDNVRFENVTVDCNHLETAVLVEMGEAAPSGVIGFFKVDDLRLKECTVHGGYGFNGIFFTLLGTENINIRHCNAHGRKIPGANNSYTLTAKAGFWIDGANFFMLHDNYVIDCSSPYTLAGNRDVNRPSRYGVVARNQGVDLYGTGVNVVGEGVVVADNEFITPRGQCSAVQFAAYRDFPARANLAVGNKLTFVPAAPGQKSGRVVNYVSRVNIDGVITDTPNRDNAVLNNAGVNLFELAAMDSPAVENNVMSGNGLTNVTTTNGASVADNIIVA